MVRVRAPVLLISTFLLGCVDWNFDPDIAVTFPRGGETFVIGTAVEFTWRCPHVDNVRIELSRDGGTTWEVIVATLATPPRRYAWTVTGPPSDQCVVRVADVAGTVFGQSGGAFSIVDAGGPVPPSASLSGLDVSTGALSPGFAPDTTFYTVAPAGFPLSMTVTPTASDSGATITVNGTVVASGQPSDPISLDPGVNTIAILVTATDGTTQRAYTILVFRGGPAGQEAYLKASNTQSVDRFGYAVAIDGDTIVIGARSESSSATGVNGNQADNGALASGAAYVFTRTGGVWSQQAYLKASNTDVGDEFGIAVAIDGDTIVVGAWQEDSSAAGVNGNQADDSATDSGAAYVFARTGGAWIQQAYLKASNTEPNDHFGLVVAIEADTVVIGAREEDSSAAGVNGNQTDNIATDSGAAYVFVRSGGIWTQEAYLKASNTDPVDHSDFFGCDVAIDGDTIVVGAEHESSAATGVNGNQADNSAPSGGAAYVFTRTGGVWSQQAYLKPSNTDAVDYFGCAVAVAGDTVVVGADGERSRATGVNGNQADNGALTSGAAYVFTRTGGVWSQQAYLKASNTDAGDRFGDVVAVDGDIIVVGAWLEDSSATGMNGDEADDSETDSGAAYVFTRTGGVWSPEAYLKATNTGSADRFGYTVAIDAGTIVVGAYGEDSSAKGVNGDQASNTALGSGAAYVFR